MSERIGDWIQVVSGRQFWPLDPRPEDVLIEDIAHALSQLCRFGGQTKTFYSVGEHSVRVSLACPPEHALWGLLHDAAEAYIVDVPRPVKRILRESVGGPSAYDACEEAIMICVVQRFGLSWPQPEAVDVADVLLLATEARDLMAPLHSDWHHQEKNGYDVLPERIIPWTPGRARWEFLKRFVDLEQARQRAKETHA